MWSMAKFRTNSRYPRSAEVIKSGMGSLHITALQVSPGAAKSLETADDVAHMARQQTSHMGSRDIHTKI